MRTYQIIRKLEEYNEWRRYDGELGEGPLMPDPKEVGITIQEAILRLHDYLHYEEETRGEIADLKKKAESLKLDNLDLKLDRLDFETKVRIELDGHTNSELFGEDGLIAATMRCIYAVKRIEEICESDCKTKEELLQRVREVLWVR